MACFASLSPCLCAAHCVRFERKFVLSLAAAVTSRTRRPGKRGSLGRVLQTAGPNNSSPYTARGSACHPALLLGRSSTWPPDRWSVPLLILYLVTFPISSEITTRAAHRKGTGQLYSVQGITVLALYASVLCKNNGVCRVSYTTSSPGRYSNPRVFLSHRSGAVPGATVTRGLSRCAAEHEGAGSVPAAAEVFFFLMEMKNKNAYRESKLRRTLNVPSWLN